MQQQAIFWLVLTVVFAMIEGLTPQMVTIWFAAGSLGALITAICGGPIWLQGIVFVTLSLVLLAATRPMAKRLLKAKPERTNADRLIGSIAIVTQDINNDEATGEAKASGQAWTARSAGGETIPAGTKVRVVEISGVKLMVEPVKEPAAARV